MLYIYSLLIINLSKLNKSFFAFLLLLVFSCSPDEETQEPTNIVSSDYSSSAPYNLNIVYFTPKDFTIRNDSHRRISEILLQGQAFVKEQMESYGFGEKTFGLLTNNEQNRVKIIYLTGKFNASNYPYSDPYYGGDKIKEEIDSYFMANPQDVRSQHTLVIIPVDDPMKSDAPFYGSGRWSFATDNNDMDVKYLGGNPSDT